MEDKDTAFSKAVITLLKSIVFKERQVEIWETISEQTNQINDYVKKLGLQLIVDELNEYAYLKQLETESIPRLVPRHQLSYPVSLLLVVLRKQLGEYDAANGDCRLVVTSKEIMDKMRIYFKDTTNEIKFCQDMERCIARVEEMGFLRKLKDRGDTYEVERIVRSFVTADWLRDFEEQLLKYRAQEEEPKEHTAGGGIDGLI